MSGLLWFKKPSEMLLKAARATAGASFSISQVYAGPYALVHDAMTEDFKPGPREKVELVSARIYRVAVDTDDYGVIVICRVGTDGPEYTVYCGDKQINGEFRNDGKTLAGVLKASGKFGENLIAALVKSAWVGSMPDMMTDNFFKSLKRTGRFCSHVDAVLSNMVDHQVEVTLPDGSSAQEPGSTVLAEMAAEITSWIAGDDLNGATAIKELSPEEAAVMRAAFVKPVLLAGERGSGKTYLARQLADTLGAVYLEMQMHPSMEAWEFRAHDRAWNGKVYTVLGKLAEAVFHIQQGRKVVLCMDEFLNMNPIYQTVINTALTRTKDDTYLIETGRIIDQGDGIGTLETVEVPCDMLWPIATSNVGPRYQLDAIAPSVLARFRVVMMNTNASRTEGIVQSNLEKLDMPLEFATMFRDFIERINMAVEQGDMKEEATTRLACDVIKITHAEAVRNKKLATLKTAKQWLPFIKANLLEEMTQCVTFELGKLDEGQAEVYSSLVAEIFRA